MLGKGNPKVIGAVMVRRRQRDDGFPRSPTGSREIAATALAFT